MSCTAALSPAVTCGGPRAGLAAAPEGDEWRSGRRPPPDVAGQPVTVIGNGPGMAAVSQTGEGDARTPTRGVTSRGMTTQSGNGHRPAVSGRGDGHTRNVTGGWDTDPGCHRRVGSGAVLQRPRAAQGGRRCPRGAAVTVGPRARGRPGPCAVCVRPRARRRRSAPPAPFLNAACASSVERASRGGGVAAPPERGERFWMPRCALCVAGAPRCRRGSTASPAGGAAPFA